MSLLKINQDPSPTTLRWFGLSQAAILILIGGTAHWRFQFPVIAYGLWSFAALFVGVYYAVPPSRRWLYIAFACVTYPIGVGLSFATLFVIYFGLFTVVGLLMRMLGHDPLSRRFDRTANTYWTPREPRPPASSYFRQF